MTDRPRLNRLYTLIAEDVRLEATGKLTITGYYPAAQLMFAKLPADLPQLIFLQILHSDKPVECEVNIVLRHMQSGMALWSDHGRFEMREPGQMAGPIILRNVRFGLTGDHYLEVAYGDLGTFQDIFHVGQADEGSSPGTPQPDPILSRQLTHE